MSEPVAIVAGAGTPPHSRARLSASPLGIRVNAVAPQLLDTAKNHLYRTPDLLVHAVAPEAVADIVVYVVSDAAPVRGAVVPAYGA